jgi:hypothetical protein
MHGELPAQKKFNLAEVLAHASEGRRTFYIHGHHLHISAGGREHVLHISSPTLENFLPEICSILNRAIRDDRRYKQRSNKGQGGGSKQFQKRHAISQSRQAAE